MEQMVRLAAPGLIRTLATGNRQAVRMTNRSRKGPDQIFSGQRGFTLLEISLVLLLIITISAMVMPNIFQASGSQMEDEADQLTNLLRLASEEAQVSGTPIRWVATENGYGFEGLDKSNKWQPLHEKPFTPIQLNSSEIKQVRQGGEQLRQDSSELIAAIVLSPDRSMVADIIMVTPSGEMSSEGKEITLQLRPGPNGIRIAL